MVCLPVLLCRLWPAIHWLQVRFQVDAGVRGFYSWWSHCATAPSCLLRHAGHTLSWGQGYPELLTDCFDSQGKPTGQKGPLNPARNETYGMLWTLIREVVERFPDAYLHLGGDEVPFDCWQVPCPTRRAMRGKKTEQVHCKL